MPNVINFNRCQMNKRPTCFVNAAPSFKSQGHMYWVVVNDPEKYLKESKTRVCYVFPASEGNKPANLAICWNNGHDFSNSFKGAKKDEPQEFLRLLLSFPDEAQESFHRLLLPAFVDTGTGLFTKLIFERPQPATEAQPVAASGTKKGKKTK